MFNLIRNLHLSLSLGQVGSLRLRPPENLRLRKKKTLVTINHMCNIQKRLKEAQELSDLKDENMALEYELNRQKDLMARLMQRVEAALNFLEEKLPEQFRPYVQRARAHIMPEPKQKHRNDRGMSMGGMER